jgi:WD40 repeat protein
MGVVYKARQKGLNRLVALKMILAGAHASEQELARFRTEAEAVARLLHPHIVQIYEVGEQDGRPYFSLELVDGGSLADRLDGTPQPPRQAAELVQTLARAMHHAHQHGVVHRDLKPANVLLQGMSHRSPPMNTDPADLRPAPPIGVDLCASVAKITDFGLAKRLDRAAQQTQSGAIVGTPSYMAPEQAGGQTKAIGPAADTYALGAILYELLTGRPPFKAETPLDTVLQVVSEEPVPPARLVPKLPRDLETICLKCLQKQPARRYASAEQLADDLRRFLNDEPILARPIGAWERGLKWAKRRPALATLAGVSLAAAVALLAGGVWYNARLREAYAEAEAQRRAATLAHTEAEAQRQAAAAAHTQAGQLREEARAVKADVDRQRELVKQLDFSTRRNLYFMQLGAARRHWEDAQVEQALDLLQGLRPRQTGEHDFRGFEWFYLWGQCHADLLTLRGHAGGVASLTFSPDGTRLASAGEDGHVKVWDAAAGHELLTLRGHAGLVRKVVFRPDGQRLASAGADRTVRVWDAASGQELLTLRGHTGGLWCVAYSPDGRRLASVGDDRLVKVWDEATGQELLSFPGHPAAIGGVCFSPDGRQLATSADDTRIKLWDAATGDEIRTLSGHSSHVWCVTFSPDGKRLASACLDGTAKLWDVATGQETHTLREHHNRVHSVAFSPDGQSLATAGADRTVRVWDADSGEERFTLRGHTESVWPVAFSPDGKRLASAGADHAIKVWDVSQRPEARKLAGATAVAFSPDGRRLATAGGWFHSVRIYDTATHQVSRTLFGHGGEVLGAAFSPDGQRLATASADQTVRVWDAAAGKQLVVLRGHRESVWSVAFSPDGRRLASASADQTVKVWDVTADQVKGEGATPLYTLGAYKGVVKSVVYSPDGRHLASAGWDGTVKVWDAATGQEARTWRGHGGWVDSVAFSPDGQRLASAAMDRTVKVWDVATGRELLTLRGHTRRVLAVAYSPDGQRLASVSGNGTTETGELIVWDATTGLEVLTLRGHKTPTHGVAFSPDGHRLATATIGFGPEVKVWGPAIPPLPNTDDWPMLFADDFGRPKRGTWRVLHGRSSLEQGALRGQLAQEPGHPARFVTALIGPERQLPATVDVRFDCWTSGELNCGIKLRNWRTDQDLVVTVKGAPGAFPFKGVEAEHLNRTRSAGGGRNLLFEFLPGRRYRFRLLREPTRLTFFADGAQVLSTAVSAIEAPQLVLQGTGGQPNDAIYFDNLEIRAPAAALRERRVRTRVENLCDQLLARDAVRDRLHTDATLSDAERTFALEVLDRYQEDSARLSQASWAVIQNPAAKQEAYQLALRQAEAACRLSPRNHSYLAGLGVARYRTGQYPEALDTLTRSEQLHRDERGSTSPVHLAFLALAHHRLGRGKEARAYLVRLRDLMRGESWARDQAAQAHVREAEAALASSLPDDATAKEKEAIKDLVFRADQAGWLHHDLPAYMAVWADDYRSVGGRQEQPEPHDLARDRRQAEAVHRLWFQGKVQGERRISYEDVDVQLGGDQAVLRYRSTVAVEDGFGVFGVICRLRQTPQGWKTFETRWWPVQKKQGAQRTSFDAQGLQVLDAKVEQLRGRDDPRAPVRALAEAHRFAEAYEAARGLTTSPTAPAADWVLHGDLALHAGDAQAARAAFRQALARDPAVELPGYLNRELLTYRGHRNFVVGLDFHPDGTRLASSDEDTTVKVWDAATGREFLVFRGHPARVSGVAFSPDGRRVASAGLDKTVKIWDLATGQEIHSLSGHTERIYRVAWSPDSRQVVSCSDDYTAIVWDAAAGRQLLTLNGHTDRVLGAVFSPDGRRIATASHDKTVKLWDAATGRETATFGGHSGLVIRVAFSPDGRQLASAGGVPGRLGEVKIWDAGTGREVRTLKGHRDYVETATFSPDGRRLASAGADNITRVWDAATGEQQFALRGHRGCIYAVVFSPDGRRLASASHDGTVMIWDVVGWDEKLGPVVENPAK